MIVVWRVTTHCNLDCGFCAFASSLSMPRQALDADRAMRFGRALRDYRQSSGDTVLVSWLGGEPLLWSPIDAVSRTFRDEYGLRVGVTSNGTTLGSAASIGRAAMSFDEITLSIDGMGATHERLRGWRGGFAKLQRAIGELRRASPALLIRVNTVLMRDTVGEFGSLCSSLAAWGVDEVTFNQLGGNDRPEFHREQRLLPADIDALERSLPALRAALAGRNVKLAGTPRYLERFKASARGERLPVEDCRPGEDFLFIDELGRVAPCSFTVSECGEVVDRLDGDDVRRLRDRYRGRLMAARPACCLDCPSTRVFAKFAA